MSDDKGVRLDPATLRLRTMIACWERDALIDAELAERVLTFKPAPTPPAGPDRNAGHRSILLRLLAAGEATGVAIGLRGPKARRVVLNDRGQAQRHRQRWDHSTPVRRPS